ncbi:MAG: DNA polymerase, partial [Chloroflexota bacterium]|nr:DNA polymerase [Chloroflexota bacterium]
MRPKLIIPVGAAAIRWVLSDSTLTVSQTHGLPKEVTVAGHRTVVFPCFHPAAGLRRPQYRKLVTDDFKNLGAFLADGMRFNRNGSMPDLVAVRVSMDVVVEAINGSPSVAVDTESDEQGLFCMSFSVDGQVGYVLHRDDLGIDGAKRLTEALNRPELSVSMHHALYDLKVLESVGINVDKTVFDSMIAAYLLGRESQALKELAYRDLGLKMTRYDDLVGQYGAEKVKRYLLAAAKHKYGPMPPEDKWEWNKAKTDILLKTHKHQPLEKKLMSMARKVERGDDGFKLVENLEGVERGAIERATGLTVPHPTIADVPTEAEWVRYSAMDAIATYQLRPILERQIKQWNMESLLWDMELPLVPILNKMTAQGICWDKVENERIAKEMSEKLEDALGRVWWEAGTPFNVSSPQQVAWLLFNRLGLTPTKRTKTGGISTDDDVLEELKGQHPVVDAIMAHREIDKLKGTYIDVYPRIVHPDGRIRTTFKQTRTATGRLASEAPNIQNVPVEGYGIIVRRVFTAPSWDWVLLSV